MNTINLVRKFKNVFGQMDVEIVNFENQTEFINLPEQMKMFVRSEALKKYFEYKKEYSKESFDTISFEATPAIPFEETSDDGR